VQGLYRNISKELKKIDSAEKSPMHSHFKESLNGLETIRSYGIEALLCEEHHRLLDRSVRARLNWDFANRWMGIRLDLIGSLVLSAAAFSVAFSALSSSSGGQAGLMLSYALKATQNLTFAIRASAALENMFTSPDRVKEYIGLEQEVSSEDATDSPLHLEGERLIKSPHENHNDRFLRSDDSRMVLKADNVVARYAPDLPPALNRISFTLTAGKLVGVCGRTGCGKSTLTLFLARALQSFQGGLFLNGESYDKIPLSTYRKEVQVFPQGSYIFAGRLREFLDPRGIHDDRKLNEILKELTRALDSSSVTPSPSCTLLPSSTSPQERAEIQDVHGGSIQQLNLELMNTAGGGNLSAGQRQVLALARAALTDAHVVLLDEITSNMDLAGAARAVEIVKR
jgi:ABC-type multidrug transport system fused ATPase/permease subunit